MDARGRLPRPGASDIGSAFDALAHGVIEDEDAIRLQGRFQESLDGG